MVVQMAAGFPPADVDTPHAESSAQAEARIESRFM
jgi:hypothetical protein